MIFKILTLFPEIFPGPLSYSITGRALVEKKFQIEAINIREFSKNKSKTVDDKPYGGGPGMIFKPDILQRSLNFAKKKARKKTKIIMLSANGRKFDQKFAKETIKNDELIIICGRYEGVDQRFIDFNSIEEISIGDYVLSGGEIPALILIDTCVRLIPEVLGNNKSLNSESFNNHLLEYPQYTKPLNWKELKVPDVLLSGDHKKIFDWRLKKSIEKTKKVRPDLLKLYFEKK
jgi:tRNA (guanine37-N1)-methyltransferase